MYLCLKDSSFEYLSEGEFLRKWEEGMIPLALIGKGERVEIIDLIKRGKAIFCHLRDMGLFEGKIIEVLDNQNKGLIIVKIDNSRLAIGRGMAMKIIVRRLT